MQWWMWLLVGWMTLAVVLAPLLGRVLRNAERRERKSYAALAAQRPVEAPNVRFSAGTAPRRRRRLPFPPVAVTLCGIGVSLEAVGFFLRAAGQERDMPNVLSRDEPLSAPRMYIAALFAAAALAAFLGGVRATGRRPWWGAVGGVAAVVAEVKAGATVHVRALAALGVAERPVLAAAGSVAVLAAVLGLLWWLSRTERRGRRCVLTAFALYGVASVEPSAVSSVVGDSLGASVWTTTATS